jgi:hypothetical protein
VSKTGRDTDGRCRWIKDDGGRSASGIPRADENASDCVARAIAIAAQKPYREVHEALIVRTVQHAHEANSADGKWVRRRGGARAFDADHGCPNWAYGPYLESLGWKFTDTKDQRIHLRADELPSGRLVVEVHRHLVAVVDGVIHDVADSGGKGRRPVTGYWTAGEAAGESKATAACAADLPRESVMNLDQRCKAINALAAKHAKGEDKNEQYLISIGRHIAAIKQEHPKDWESIVKKRCDLGRSRAYELMKIGDGTQTVEKLRLVNAEAQERFRKNKKDREEPADENPLRNGQPETSKLPPAGGNGSDPDISAEQRKAEYAALEDAGAGDGTGAEAAVDAAEAEADDDSHYQPPPREQLEAFLPLLDELERVAARIRELTGDDEWIASYVGEVIPDHRVVGINEAFETIDEFRRGLDLRQRLIPTDADYEAIGEKRPKYPSGIRTNEADRYRDIQERAYAAAVKRLSATVPVNESAAAS